MNIWPVTVFILTINGNYCNSIVLYCWSVSFLSRGWFHSVTISEKHIDNKKKKKHLTFTL